MTLLGRRVLTIAVLAVAVVFGSGAYAQAVTFAIDLSSACGDSSIDSARTVDVGTTVTVGFAVTVTGGLGGFSISFPSWPGGLEYVANSAAICEGFTLQGTTNPGTGAGGTIDVFRSTAIRSTNVDNPSNLVILLVQYNAVAAGSYPFDDLTMRNGTTVGEESVPSNQRPIFVVDGVNQRVPHTLVSAALNVGGVIPPTDTPIVGPTDTPIPPTDTPIVGPTDTPVEVPTDTPCDNCADDVGLVILDGFGGLHAVGTAQDGRSYRENVPYWTSSDITRDLALDKKNVAHALILDLFGGVHYVNWANAADIVANTPFYYIGQDIAVDAELSGPVGDGAYVITKHGLVDESGAEAQAAPLDNTEILDGEANQYVDLELLYDAGGVAVGFWAMDNNGNIVAGGAAPQPDVATLALLGAGTASDFVQFEVVPFGESVMIITMQSTGVFHHNFDDPGTPELEPLPDGTDLTDLPVFGSPIAVDFEYQTAAEGGTSINDPSASLPGVVMMDAFGRIWTTFGAEKNADSPAFGQEFGVDVEVANFSETIFNGN